MALLHTATVLLAAVLSVCSVCLAQGASGPTTTHSELDAETIQAGLRTADPQEQAYIAYVVTLANQGRLPRAMVVSSFQWARRKPVQTKKFQYFKHALMRQAAKIGVRLPSGGVDLTPRIDGRVMVQLLLLRVPAANITVSIRGTDRKTVTNLKGEFSFDDVPLGTHVLDARGIAAFLPMSGWATVVLPPRPPRTDAVYAEIRLN